MSNGYGEEQGGRHESVAPNDDITVVESKVFKNCMWFC